MPLTAGSNVSYSPGVVCDLIYSDTALPSTVFGNWLRTADNSWGAFALATVFDVRAYSTVIVTLSCTAVTGTSTPTAQLLIILCEDSDGLISGPQFTVSSTVGASGGVARATFGVEPTMHVGMSDNFAMGRSPERLQFFKIGTQGSGLPTGFTNGRLRVWGLRD